MNRYGFVIIPDKDNSYYCKSWAGAARGLVAHFEKAEDIVNNNTLPPVVFYDNPEVRNVEMDALARKFPGILVAPFDIKEAIKYPAAAQPTKFSISDKGILPA